VRRHRGCGRAIPVNDAKISDFADGAECVADLDGKRLGLGRWQKLAAVLDDFLSITIGEKSEVPDLHKSARQHMQEKPPDELDGIQGHLFDLIAIPRIAPPKTYAVMVQTQQPPVGNGYSMGVPRQILEHLLRTAERGLGVNDPLLLTEG